MKQRSTALLERLRRVPVNGEASCLLCLHKRSPFVYQQNNQAFHREPGQPCCCCCCCCIEGCSHTSMHRSILIRLVCIRHLGLEQRWDMRQSSGRSHCSTCSLSAGVVCRNFIVSPPVTFSTEQHSCNPGVTPEHKHLASATACRVFESHGVQKNFILCSRSKTTSRPLETHAHFPAWRKQESGWRQASILCHVLAVLLNSSSGQTLL